MFSSSLSSYSSPKLLFFLLVAYFASLSATEVMIVGGMNWNINLSEFSVWLVGIPLWAHNSLNIAVENIFGFVFLQFSDEL